MAYLNYTIFAVVFAVFLSFPSTAFSQATVNISATDSTTGGRTQLGETDDGSVAGGRIGVVNIGFSHVWDGSVWRRETIGTAGTPSAQVVTVQGITSMTPLLATLSGTNTVTAVTSITNPVAVTGTFWQATQPVSVATIPSHDVTNAGTFATQAAQSGTWNIGTVTTVTGATITALPNEAQQTMANSISVAIASDQSAVPASQSGTWNVTNVSGTVSLPTGAATAAKQPALGTAGNSSTDVITVQGIASGTALPISVATLPSHEVTNAGTFAVQASQTGGWTMTAVQGGGWTMTVDNIGPTPSADYAVEPEYIVTTASTNAGVAADAPANFYGIERALNTTTTIAYLRLYNLAASPTCSSATGFIESVPIFPAAASGGGGGVVAPAILPTNYTTGIAYCVTGGGTSTDNTNAPAGIYIKLLYKE